MPLSTAIQLARPVRLLIAALGAVAVVSVASPDAHASAVGALLQLPSPNDCVEQDSSLLSVGGEGCGTGGARGLLGASTLAVSPDGRDVYVTTGENLSGLVESDSVVELSRNAATGGLSEFGCISETGAECDLKADGLTVADAIAVSPDGTRVYVGSPAAGIDVFERAADGSLSLIQCFKRTSDSGDSACTTLAPDLEGVDAFAVSADGSDVYAAEQNGNAIAIFARTASNTLEYKGCISEVTEGPGCTLTNAVGLLGVAGLAVSPSGERLYAVSYTSNALVTFSRNPTTGALTYLSCESGDSGAKGCGITTAGGLGSAQSVVVSPDGSRIYVVGLEGALSTFAPTAPGTSELGCLSASGKEPACTPAGANLSGGQDLVLAPAVAPGGGALYTTSFFAQTVNAFSIEPITGLPVALPGADACLEAGGSSAGCSNTGRGLNAADGIAASPDGQNIYVASRGADTVQCGAKKCTDTVSAVAAFSRVPVPALLPGGASLGGTPPPPLPPVLSGVRESAKKWREGKKLAQISRKHKKKQPPVGSTFSFSLSEAASVTFTFTQRVRGREVGHNCVAKTRKNAKRKSCRRTVTAGTLTFTAHAGTNKVVFQGRVSHRRKLARGRYTLVISGSNSAGRSASKSLSFTIVK